MNSHALWLAKKEIKYQWPAFLSTLLFTVLVAFVASIFLKDYLATVINEGGQVLYIDQLFLDLLFFGFTPSMAALYISGPYMNFRSAIKDDPFSKRMALYRSLPISIDIITKSRAWFMLFTFLIMSVVFYVVLTLLLSAHIVDFITPAQWFIFMMIWFGYALGLGGLNMYVEFGTNGKILHLLPWLFLLLFVMIILFMQHIIGYTFVDLAFMLTERAGWLAVLAALIFGIAGCLLWPQLLYRRLLKRDFL